MLRLLPDTERRCCPACRDVELRFIAACDGTSFLACAQCLRRFAAGLRRDREADIAQGTALSALKRASVRAAPAA